MGVKWELDLWYETWDRAGSQGLDTWYELSHRKRTGGRRRVVPATDLDGLDVAFTSVESAEGDPE